MDSPNLKLVEVYRARNLPEAHALRIKLEDAGIRVRIDGELLQGVLGEVPMGWATAPRLMVEASQADEARAIIDLVPVVADDNEEDEDEDDEDEEPTPTAVAVPALAGPPSPRSRRWPVMVLILGLLVVGGFFLYRATVSTGSDYDRGVEALDRKEYDRAISWFNKAIRSDPKNAAAYYRRAQAHDAQGNHDAALADLNQALGIAPRLTDAYILRGNIYHGKGDYAAAIREYNDAIRLEPEYSLGHLNRGIAYREKKEYARALDDFNVALQRNPNDVTALTARGGVLFLKGSYDRARGDFQEAIRIDPNAPYAHSGLAWLWAACPDDRFRDGKRAVESARKACELTEWKDPDFFDTLAAAHAEAGDFDEAVRWQQKALASPAFGSKHGNQASDTEEARARLKLYQERKPYREK